jgi:hypothetical protein
MQLPQILALRHAEPGEINPNVVGQLGQRLQLRLPGKIVQRQPESAGLQLAAGVRQPGRQFHV